MTKRSHVVALATIIAWLVQAAVATILFVAMRILNREIIRQFPVVFAESMLLFLIVYIPQFLVVFSPVTCLLRKLDRNSLTASVLAGVAASLLGIGLNYIWLTPFADAGDHFVGLEMIQTYQRLSVDVVAAIGGVAAGCSYWLVTNFSKRRRALAQCERVAGS